MKTKFAIIAITLCVSILTACNTKHGSNNHSTEPAAEHATHSENETNDTLALNNGVKWLADAPTNKNVTAIKQIVESATPVTVTDYQNTAASLQQALNVMITECRMAGEDHEALHRWLEPLLEDADNLQKVTTTAEAAALFNSIKHRAALYDQYFQ